jgi:alkanesulfonate monooxygenase SsuD/methylene tetrahydromethanopterin reductase-like flavin-dependent oxidoreductase (luciferase family)
VSFGLFLPIQARGTSLPDLVGELVEEVVAAEAAGFEAVYLPEFHQARGGALVSPLLLLAAFATRTSRIKLGTLVAAAPLYDPVRLAEDALTLQQISRGRLILGLGSAHVDFELFGRDRSRRFRALDECLDVLDAAFTGEPFDVHGRTGQMTGADGTRPPVWIGAHGPRGLRRAAERGDAWVCDPQRDIATVARLADEYRAYGGEQVVLFREAWIGDPSDWIAHANKVHRLYLNVGAYPEPVEDFAPGRFLIGDDLRATADEWRQRTGASQIAVRMRQPTGPSHAATLEAIARFGAEVI